MKAFVASSCLIFAAFCADTSAQELLDRHPGQAEISIVPVVPDRVQIRIPEEIVSEELTGSDSPDLQIYDFEFHTPANPYEFQIYTHLLARSPGANFDCTIDMSFAIPGAPIASPRLLTLENRGGCYNNGILGGLADVVTPLLHDVLENQLRQRIPFDTTSLPSDPQVGPLITDAWVQGEECDSSTMKKAICLDINWQLNGLSLNMNRIAGSAPVALGPGSTVGLSELHDKFVAGSQREKITYNNADYYYPIKIDKDSQGKDFYSENDMALFGGLLCLSGDPEGCTLVERSQGASGQYWRSPKVVDQTDPNDEFSGDQLIGIMAYMTAKKPTAAFSTYLSYISNNKANLPDDKVHLDVGYKTCELDISNTCTLIGQDWLLIEAVANSMGLSSLIPPSEANIKQRFGFTTEFLPWEAMLYPAGFRLNLIGAQIYVLRKLGIDDQYMDEAAAVLSSRQPKNAFFAYLHLGKDQYVTSLVENECVTPGASPMDWVWERPDSQGVPNPDHPSDPTSYQANMGWDCVFMINNLLH